MELNLRGVQRGFLRKEQQPKEQQPKRLKSKGLQPKRLQAKRNEIFKQRNVCRKCDDLHNKK